MPKARIRRRLIDRLREAVTGAGGVWIRLAPFPYPYRSAFSFRADLDEPVADDYFRFADGPGPAGRLLHAFRQHARLRPAPAGPARPEGPRHAVARPLPPRLPRPGGQRRNLERAHRILRQRRVRAGRLRRAARPMERRPGRRSRGPRLPLLVRLPARLRRLAVLPLEGRPVLASAPDPDPPGLRGPVPRGRRRPTAEVDRRVSSAGRRSRSSTRASSAFVYGHPERRLGRMPEVLTDARPDGRGRAAGLARDVHRVGALVAVAGRAAVAGHLPARIIAWKSSSTTGTPSTRSPGDPPRPTSSARCP